MSGRRRPEPVPVLDAVSWERVSSLSVTGLVRPSTLRRKELTGQLAVRVATMSEGVRYFAPSEPVSATRDEIRAYALYDAM